MKEHICLSAPMGPPEHLQMAISVANEILSRFSLEGQNQFIAQLSQRVWEARINETHELEMRIETIRGSLDGLGPPPILDGAFKR